MMSSHVRFLSSLTVLAAVLVSCGSDSNTNTPAPAPEKTGFDYAAFIARTPVDHLDYDAENVFDSADYDPAAATETLRQWDDLYTAAGLSSRAPITTSLFSTRAKACKQGECAVWVSVSKATQTLSLYIDGVLEDSWLVSTGTGSKTPDFDRHPNGRIYDQYSSKSYPGGDYNGLGNMPYAVFIEGGYALHGTPKSNWKYLGQKASHGCVRMHPDNGYRFNRLVREVGIKQTWITVD